MERRLEEIQTQLEGLSRELGDLRTRLERLEARDGAAPAGSPGAIGQRAAAAEAAALPELGPVSALFPTGTTALVGRTLVVLGGAYLLRAISETGAVPALGGALAGLAYAIWWLVQVDRTAPRDRASAIFHGIAAVAIGFPLIWETTAGRFDLFSGPAAAAALFLFAGLGLAIAWRRALEEIGWMVLLFALATTLALVVGTRQWAPYAVALLGLGVIVEGAAWRDRSLGLRWPVAIGLDLVVLGLTSVVLRAEAPPEGRSLLGHAGPITVTLALPVLYMVSTGARTLLRERPVTPFEILQSPLALLIGFSGAVRILTLLGIEPTSIGVAVLLLGAACYAAAFSSIDRRLGRTRNFYTYTTLAGLLVLAGSYLFLSRTPLALTWSALAIGAVTLGGHFDRITLRAHGAVYVVAAAVVAGLLGCTLDGLLGASGDTWRPVTPLCLLTAGAAATCYLILLAMPQRRPVRGGNLLPQAIIAAVVLLSVAGLLAPLPAERLAAASGDALSSAHLAASRTVVLALLAVLLAWTGRVRSYEELVWLVYPLLVLGGAKLLWEDFRHGQAATLFIGLAFYGSALIITPRLLRRPAHGSE